MAKGYELSEPNPDDYVIGYDFEYDEYCYNEEQYKIDRDKYEESEFIAEVENIKVEEILPAEWDFMKVGLRVFIELTENGKCKIVKI